MDMSYEEFLNYVQENIGHYIPDMERATLTTVDKNNGITHEALIITTEGNNVAPVIYMDAFYEHLKAGQNLSALMNDIARLYAKGETERYQSVAEKYMDWDWVKEHLVISVINAEQNEKMLKEIPYTLREDLALTYKVELESSREETSSIIIRNDHLKYWGVTTEQLHEQALKSCNVLRPAVALPIHNIMSDFLPPEDLAELTELEPPMYVVSNPNKINGAAAIFYSDVAAELAEDFHRDLIILPSSVHEVIVLPDDGVDPQFYAEMVREVNATQVADDEILSEHVYRYNAKEKTIKLADVSIEQLQKQEKEQVQLHHRTGKVVESRSPKL